jgi:hypothetical protein
VWNPNRSTDPFCFYLTGINHPSNRFWRKIPQVSQPGNAIIPLTEFTKTLGFSVFFHSLRLYKPEFFVVNPKLMVKSVHFRVHISPQFRILKHFFKNKSLVIIASI